MPARRAWVCVRACGKSSSPPHRLHLDAAAAAAAAWLSRERRQASCTREAVPRRHDCLAPAKFLVHEARPTALLSAVFREWPAALAGGGEGKRFAVRSCRHYHILELDQPTVVSMPAGKKPGMRGAHNPHNDADGLPLTAFSSESACIEPAPPGVRQVSREARACRASIGVGHEKIAGGFTAKGRRRCVCASRFSGQPAHVPNVHQPRFFPGPALSKAAVGLVP